MKKKIIIMLTLLILLGCSLANNQNANVDLKNLKVGEMIYVCGCPDMCCNSISRDQNGRCACNYPLKKGSISRIQDGKIYVNISGLEKSFFILNN